MNDRAIPEHDSVKYLGVVVDDHLKFNKHINHIVTRANRAENLIHKCFISKDPETLVKAFTTYVRPTVEYASCI